MRVLLLGSGGREHAMSWAILRSASLDKLYVCPGSDAISEQSDLLQCVDGDPCDAEFVCEFCEANSIDLVIIGPEAPLVAGVADRTRQLGLATFGPNAAAAQLESSKVFTKQLCDAAGIATAPYAACHSLEDLQEAVIRIPGSVAVKADGLAAGKGVIIASSAEEAVQAGLEMLQGRFGQAGNTVVVEKFLEGIEVSCFALVDGDNLIVLPPVQDYKQVGDGDTGANTGGMGAVSPVSVLSSDQLERVKKDILEPTVAHMRKQGIPYQGVLYAGLMVTSEGIYLLEYNVRFGDPECQVLMPLMDGDWLELFHACAIGQLSDIRPTWSSQTALSVVLASADYPLSSGGSTVINGIESAITDALSRRSEGECEVVVFHAGTKRGPSGKDSWMSAGGRVLNVTALANDLAQAKDLAYEVAGGIDWPEGKFRKDIGWRA